MGQYTVTDVVKAETTMSKTLINFKTIKFENNTLNIIKNYCKDENLNSKSLKVFFEDEHIFIGLDDFNKAYTHIFKLDDYQWEPSNYDNSH